MIRANYVNRLNVSTKAFALFGAALLLLDFAATSVVSAAASAVYISGEVPSLPFPTWVGSIIILVTFTCISLLGVRESTRIALIVLVIHVFYFIQFLWLVLIILLRSSSLCVCSSPLLAYTGVRVVLDS